MRTLLKRVAVVLSVATLLIASVIGIGCSKTKEGQLPTYKVGDTWTYEGVVEGSHYSIAFEVTGESTVGARECWVIKQTYSPAFMGITSGTVKYDKSNWFVVDTQVSGSMQGITFSGSAVHSYDPSDASLFPLELGREVGVTETTTRTTTAAGKTQTKTETKTHTYKVEAMEEITVEAGTFKCFKVTDGASIRWYSDKVKQEVKSSIEEAGITMVMELTSYSV
jgi:hypothetical protein